MQIVIDTTMPLNETETRILRLLIDGPPAQPDTPTKPEPKKRATRKKADPEPETTPAEPETTPAEPETTPAEDAAPEPVDLDEAVKKATEFISAGKSAQVKEALAAVKVKRVSELDGENVSAFLEALGS